jgi:hypothetical protein
MTNVITYFKVTTCFAFLNKNEILFLNFEQQGFIRRIIPKESLFLLGIQQGANIIFYSELGIKRRGLKIRYLLANKYGYLSRIIFLIKAI